MGNHEIENLDEIDLDNTDNSPKIAPESNEKAEDAPIVCKGIFDALLRFRKLCPPIIKDEDGHGYKYAELSAIQSRIDPILCDCGLGYYQAINGYSLKTVIFHVESGQTINSDTDMMIDSLNYVEIQKRSKDGGTYSTWGIRGFEGMNKAQAAGALSSYFRRYALTALLGIVTEKDTDGTSSVQKTQQNYQNVKTIQIADDPFV